MTQHIELDYGEAAHEGFFDAIQELLGAYVGELHLERVNSTTLKVSAGTGNSQVGIAVAGKYRWRTEATTAALPAELPDGDHPIFVTASANDFGGPLGDPDEATDYAFGLQIKPEGETPATAHYRQIGIVTVASGAISSFQQTAGKTTGAMLISAFADGDIVWSRNADGKLVASLATLVGQGIIPSGTILATGRKTAPSGYLLCEGQEVSRATYKTLWEAIEESGYGSGDGSTTFKLPDLRGRVPVGVDGAAGRLSANDALAKTGGEEKVKLKIEHIPGHKHGTGTLSTNTTGSHGHGVSDPGHAHSAAVWGSYVTTGGGLGGNVNANLSGGSLFYASYVVVNGAFTGISIQAAGNHAHTISGETGEKGSGTEPEHNNMPPYQIVNYMIKI